MKILKGLLPFLLVFASLACCCINELIPGLITYKQLAIVMAAISLFVLFFNAEKLLRLNSTLIFVILAIFVICSGFYITGHYLYRFDSFGRNIYNGEFLAVLGQSSPLILMSIVLAQDDSLLEETKKCTPWIALLFSLVSFKSAFHPTGITSGGYALDENGMNYQSISYMAAYGLSFTSFYLLCFKRFSFGFFFRSKFAVVLMIGTVFLNLYTILIAGGRGGLVAFAILLSVFLFYLGKNTKGIMALKISVVLIISIFLVLYVFNAAEYSQIESSGFSRILRFLEEGDDAGRAEIRRIAWASFMESPVYGHGIGSSMFVIGNGTFGQHIHGHNFFLDSLIETGILGTCFWFYIIIRTIRRLIGLVKNNLTDYIWLVFFMDGFIMSLFSGYYLANLPIVWSIGFILSRTRCSGGQMPDNTSKSIPAI